MNIIKTIAVIILASFVTIPTYATANTSNYEPQEQAIQKKLKLAIGRFSNETRYGKSLLRDGDLDPLGKQASDILSTMLTGTERFLVFERPDLRKIQREQNTSGSDKNIIGVDTLILGSIVEFGRSVNGKRGVFNRKKEQTARASVTIRLVDVKTGLVFHSATGSGEATTSTKTVLGVGSTAEYDATLNDRAISAAISKVIDELVGKLKDRKWRTDILQVANGIVYIAGGKSQGLSVGDQLTILKSGMTIQSNDSGFDITLPPTTVATIRITGLFGETETSEGAIAEVISGTVADGRPEGLYVAEGS